MIPAGINIDPQAIVTCALKGHGTTVSGPSTRNYARYLGLWGEVAIDMDVYVFGPGKAPLIAAMGRELVRRITR